MTTKTIIIESTPNWPTPTLRLLPEAGGAAVDTQSAVADGDDAYRYSAAFVDLAAGRYRWRLLSAGVVVDGGFVTLEASAGSYLADELKAIAGEVDVEASLVKYFQTDARMSGQQSVLSTLRLIAAAVAGPVEVLETGEERFADFDAVVAFTTSFDGNGHRSAVEIGA